MMASVRKLLIENGLGRIAAQAEAAVKYSAELSIGKPGEGNTHRLGGRPNLPPTLEWPMWRDSPLAFVAQIELSQLPVIEGLDLPRIGSLYFFSQGGRDAWGFRPDDIGSSCVHFAAGSLRMYPLREFPPDLPDHLRFDGFEVAALLSKPSIPNPEDFCLQSLNLSGQELESYHRIYEGWVGQTMESFHRVGGYPDCIQGDPKLTAQLVSRGLYCGDQSGYVEGKERGLWVGAADWDLLLQVDSEGGIGMEWGGSGRLYFLIHRRDVQQRRFDKTWMILQRH